MILSRNLLCCTTLFIPLTIAWMVPIYAPRFLRLEMNVAASDADDNDESTVSTTQEGADIQHSPPGDGLYRPFAEAFWNELHSTDWFDMEQGFRTERCARAKGLPEGSQVRMTVQSVRGKPEAPVAYARYALLETLAVTENPSKNPIQQHVGVQVLNAVIIPRINSLRPVWGADFVALPGNKHLLLLDAQPMMVNDTHHESFTDWYNNFGVSESWPWAGDLPPAVQPYVSPKALWTRLGGKDEGDDDEQETMSPTARIATQLLPAMEAHLQIYCDLLGRNDDNTDTVESSATSSLRSYLEYRLSKDPARPMLQSLYGREWTEEILEQVLFPMELLFGKQDNA